ncbi:MAG TPA: SpoIIE family protein phosphatase [Capillimicrobium sp.]|nr:SpoIIE family protein phosphatase [Capillimicrobium sp.]
MQDQDGFLLEQWLAAADVGLALVDAQGRVLRENPALARIAGRDAAALAADPEVAPLVERARAGETPAPALLTAHGEPLHAVQLSVLPLDGAVAITVVGVTDDQVLQATLGLALDGTDAGSWVWHVDDDRIHWSPHLGPLHGLERGATPRSYEDWLAGVHPGDRDRVARQVAAALDGDGAFQFEFRTRGGDGQERWLHTRGNVLRHPDGRARAVAGLTADVTVRRRREQAAELLASAGLSLAESLDAETTLQQIADLAVPALADWCAVHVLDDDQRPRRIAVAHAGSDELERAAPVVTDAEAARGPAAVIRSGRSELHPSVDDALLRELVAGDEHLALLRELGPTAAMVVPVSAGGRTLGAITFVHAESRRSYDEQDLELAEEIGRRAGLAMENAALHRAQRDANRRLRDLQTVTDVALTHLEVDALLSELLDRLAEVLDADITKVLLYDERRTALRVRASRGLRPEAVRNLRVPSGAGAAGRIAAAGRPLILEDTGEADIVLDDLREAGRSLAGVPLQLDAEIVGVLVVSSRSRIYEEADLRLLELVADRAARAIRQAELYEAARDAALTLQRSLLPEALPTIDGLEVSAQYLPGQDGTEVGGDWYDLFELPDGRLAIVVGDVVGRGLRAATRMGRVRAALRAYAFESRSPAEAIERMDRLVAAEDSIEFTTLLAIYLDPGTGAAQACSAGHLPPLFVDEDGARLGTVPAGPPLGVAAGPRRQTDLEMGPDTFLVAYTDGLVEDRERGLDTGMQRLLDAAAEGGGARELVDRVVERLVLPGSNDDVAIVVVGRVRAGLARSFAAEPSSVATVRAEVAEFARAQGVPESVVRDVALAVSEACTNVVLHAYRDGEPGQMHVTARRDEDGLEVTVTDEGGGVRPRADSPGVGLGLQIIARTTDRFDVRDAPGGGAQLVLRFGAPVSA